MRGFIIGQPIGKICNTLHVLVIEYTITIKFCGVAKMILKINGVVCHKSLQINEPQVVAKNSIKRQITRLLNGLAESGLIYNRTKVQMVVRLIEVLIRSLTLWNYAQIIDFISNYITPYIPKFLSLLDLLNISVKIKGFSIISLEHALTVVLDHLKGSV